MELHQRAAEIPGAEITVAFQIPDLVQGEHVDSIQQRLNVVNNLNARFYLQSAGFKGGAPMPVT